MFREPFNEYSLCISLTYISNILSIFLFSTLQNPIINFLVWKNHKKTTIYCILESCSLSKKLWKVVYSLLEFFFICFLNFMIKKIMWRVRQVTSLWVAQSPSTNLCCFAPSYIPARPGCWLGSSSSLVPTGPTWSGSPELLGWVGLTSDEARRPRCARRTLTRSHY